MSVISKSIKAESKVIQCIDSVLKLAVDTPGMGVSLYRKKKYSNDFNCQAWSNKYITENTKSVKDALVKELKMLVSLESKDIQLLITNEDDSAKALIKRLLDEDEEVRISNGLRSSKNTDKPNFILGVNRSVQNGCNYSRSYSSILDIVSKEDKCFIEDNHLKGDVHVYNIVAITEIVKYI